MKPETAGKVKYGVWGLIVGGIIAMIIGFAWGGWTTSSTTTTMTEEALGDVDPVISTKGRNLLLVMHKISHIRSR